MRLLWDERAVRKVKVAHSAPTSKSLMGYEGALCLLDRLTFDLEGLATVTRQVRPLMAQSGKGLTARPTESEHLERRSTTFKDPNCKKQK